MFLYWNCFYCLQVNLDEATDPWGVKIDRVELKDVRVPDNLVRAMAAEAEAARDARAKVLIMMMTTTKMMVIMMMTMDLFVQVIAAEGEHKASR